jgi:hypothetical protein
MCAYLNDIPSDYLLKVLIGLARGRYISQTPFLPEDIMGELASMDRAEEEAADEPNQGRAEANESVDHAFTRGSTLLEPPAASTNMTFTSFERSAPSSSSFR